MALSRLLLVTGDEELALLLQLEIGDLMPEVSTNIACGLAEALALAKLRQPDVILFGIDTPGDGGALRLLADARPGVRFILMGRAPAAHHDQPGVVGHLTIPVALSDLRAALADASDERIREDVDAGVRTDADRLTR